jgi:hypothetical protein
MSLKELAEYLNLPYELVYDLTCNWHNETLGQWSCFAVDGYNNWKAKNIILLNALPLNSFEKPMDIKLYPTDAGKLLEFLSQLPHVYKCYIGHPQTANLINKYIPVKCTRDVYKYTPGDVIIAFTLRSRAPVSGADVDVSINDLLSYIIIPQPL